MKRVLSFTTALLVAVMFVSSFATTVFACSNTLTISFRKDSVTGPLIAEKKITKLAKGQKIRITDVTLEAYRPLDYGLGTVVGTNPVTIKSGDNNALVYYTKTGSGDGGIIETPALITNFANVTVEYRDVDNFYIDNDLNGTVSVVPGTTTPINERSSIRTGTSTMQAIKKTIKDYTFEKYEGVSKVAAGQSYTIKLYYRSTSVVGGGSGNGNGVGGSGSGTGSGNGSGIGGGGIGTGDNGSSGNLKTVTIEYLYPDGTKIKPDKVITATVGSLVQEDAPIIPGYVATPSVGSLLVSATGPNKIEFTYSAVSSSGAGDKVSSENEYTIEYRLDTPSGSKLLDDETFVLDENETTKTVTAKEVEGYTISGDSSYTFTYPKTGNDDSHAFVYTKNPEAWTTISFDALGGSPSTQEFSILKGYSVSEYNALNNETAYPSIAPKDPTLKDWEFDGWFTGEQLTDSTNESFANPKAAAFSARYKKTATISFEIDPKGTGTGTIDGGTDPIAISQEIYRTADAKATTEFPFDPANVPTPKADANSYFAGWSGDNVSNDKWTGTFKDGDVNFARYEFGASEAPQTGDNSNLVILFSAMIGSLIGIVLIARIKRARQRQNSK
jgi:hypothetical protein